ncbi:MAG: oxygen-independent coproporphyrinogen-3 oxidase [Candidatus Paceibacteria bacterium]|jgi:oxygen-independent coproporphyrinogen-3 oxidase
MRQNDPDEDPKMIDKAPAPGEDRAQANAPQASSEQSTQVGNYFISNYPPYSFWSSDQLPQVDQLLASQPVDDRPLGVYVHIPFCRKRCDFCYFKVYTDKNGREIRRYLEAVTREAEMFVSRDYLRGRKPRFLYFGGGTPSYLSADQMLLLFSELRRTFDWSEVEEVTYECEPGTLTRAKVQALGDLGVTRLSLGVENFDANILKINNRAHGADEIQSAYGYARDVGFEQINIDLIAGMIGESDENWDDCIEKTLVMNPDSITVYQMELPYNTTISRQLKADSSKLAPVADWETKRRWTERAFSRFAAAGYSLSSAYTASRGDDTQFVYRDALWQGADMLGLGVSSFSHLGGIHFQNEHSFTPYVERVESGELPLARAYGLNAEELMIREFILQLKTGRIDADSFQRKFGVDVLRRFSAPLEQHRRAGMLSLDGPLIRATPQGMLHLDGLLPPFFLEDHQNARYA